MKRRIGTLAAAVVLLFTSRASALDSSLYRMPTYSAFAAAGMSLSPQNNPFFENKLEIRAAKKTATSVHDLWDRLKPIAARFHKWGDRRDLAVGAMLVVAAFYDFGNPPPDDSKTGCVRDNVNTDSKSVSRREFQIYTQSDIGCCEDFGDLLVSFLHYLHFDVSAALLKSGAHLAARVDIDGKNYYIDSNSLILVENFWGQGERRLIYWTPYDGSRQEVLQKFLISALSFGESDYQEPDWRVISAKKFFLEQETEVSYLYLLDRY